jgi:hypothetical protein
MLLCRDIPHPVRCGILTAESGPATVSETFIRIAKSKGLSASDITNCIVSTECPQLGSQEWRDDIKRFIGDNGLRCLTIDPTYLAMAGVDQNNGKPSSDRPLPDETDHGSA